MASNEDSPPLEFNSLKLPKEYHAALGLVTACSAQTENIVEIAVATLAKTDLIRGAAISTHMSAPLRDGIVRSLAQLSTLPDEALNELDHILDRVNAAFTKRNTYVHNAWGQNLTTNEVFYFRTQAKSSFSMDSVVVPLTTLQQDAIEIYDAGMALMDFLLKWNLNPADADIPQDFRGRSRKERKKRLKG